MVFSSSLLSLSLKGFNSWSVVPTNSGGEVAEVGELSEAVEHDGSDGVGNDDLLLSGEWMWASLEDFKSAQGGSSSGGLVWEHTSNSSPDELSRSFVVPRTTLAWVGVRVQCLEQLPLSEVSFNLSSNDNLLSSDDDDSLSVEELLGDDCGQSAENVVLSVYQNNFFEHDYVLYFGLARIY